MILILLYIALVFQRRPFAFLINIKAVLVLPSITSQIHLLYHLLPNQNHIISHLD